MKLDEIEKLLESPVRNVDQQIAYFASLAPPLRLHLARRGKIQLSKWWSVLRDKYTTCEQAVVMQQLHAASLNVEMSSRDLEEELKTLNRKKEALNTKLQKARRNFTTLPEKDQVSNSAQAQKGLSLGVCKDLSGAVFSEKDVSNIVLELVKQADQVERQVAELQPKVLGLENSISETMGEVAVAQAEKEQLDTLQTQGIPIVSTASADVQGLATALKRELALRDSVMDTVSRLEAQRDAKQQSCDKLCVQIDDLQHDLANIMLPTSEAIDATTEEIAELSAKLEEAEALLIAHRNRRVAASQELSAREGVAAAISISPRPPQAETSSNFKSVNKRPKVRTKATVNKDEVFVRSMLRRLERSTPGVELPMSAGAMKFNGASEEDPQLAMLRYFTQSDH